MSRVLVLSPHPDDESIGCGGTLRRHVVAGDVVRVVFLTSGEQGGHGRPPAEVGPLREAEAGAAAEILGLGPLEFWREPDGGLTVSARLVARLTELLAQWQPQLLYVTHADELLPDHRAAAELAAAAVAGLRAPAEVPAVRMYEVWTPIQRIDEIVDISEYIEVKMAAIRAHRCQCAVMRFDDAARGLSRYRGEMHSWPGGDYAEVFMSMR